MSDKNSKQDVDTQNGIYGETYDALIMMFFAGGSAGAGLAYASILYLLSSREIIGLRDIQAGTVLALTFSIVGVWMAFKRAPSMRTVATYVEEADEFDW